MCRLLKGRYCRVKHTRTVNRFDEDGKWKVSIFGIEMIPDQMEVVTVETGNAAGNEVYT